MKRKLFATGLVLMLLLSGCGKDGSLSGGGDMPATDSLMSGEAGAADQSWSMDMDMMGGNSMSFSPDAPEEAPGSSVYLDPGAKLIRRAELSIQTEQFDQSVEALKRLTDECGGYFENASLYGGGRRDAYASRSGEYVVRIPAEKYDKFLSGTGDLGYVTNKSESSQDVGEEYYDIETRLKTQRTKQERLLALLEKAETMEDIIALESALSDVEYQIEMYSSDLRRYDALVGFSTFQIRLDEVGRVTQEVGETSSLGQRMSAGIQASFHGLGQGFQDLMVWMSYHLFLTILLAALLIVAVLAGRRELKRRKKQRKEEKDPVE